MDSNEDHLERAASEYASLFLLGITPLVFLATQNFGIIFEGSAVLLSLFASSSIFLFFIIPSKHETGRIYGKIWFLIKEFLRVGRPPKKFPFEIAEKGNYEKAFGFLEKDNAAETFVSAMFFLPVLPTIIFLYVGASALCICLAYILPVLMLFILAYAVTRIHFLNKFLFNIYRTINLFSLNLKIFFSSLVLLITLLVGVLPYLLVFPIKLSFAFDLQDFVIWYGVVLLVSGLGIFLEPVFFLGSKYGAKGTVFGAFLSLAVLCITLSLLGSLSTPNLQITGVYTSAGLIALFLGPAKKTEGESFSSFALYMISSLLLITQEGYAIAIILLAMVLLFLYNFIKTYEKEEDVTLY